MVTCRTMVTTTLCHILILCPNTRNHSSRRCTAKSRWRHLQGRQPGRQNQSKNPITTNMSRTDTASDPRHIPRMRQSRSVGHLFLPSNPEAQLLAPRLPLHRSGHPLIRLHNRLRHLIPEVSWTTIVLACLAQVILPLKRHRPTTIPIPTTATFWPWFNRANTAETSRMVIYRTTCPVQ